MSLIRMFAFLIGVSVAGTAYSPCSELNSAFMDFVEANKSCTEDWECMVVGGNYSCNCSPSLGSCIGNAINRSADRAQLNAFYRVFESCQDEMGGTCDCGSVEGSECVSGRCRISGVIECNPMDEWMYGGNDGGSDEGVPDGGGDGEDDAYLPDDQPDRRPCREKCL